MNFENLRVTAIMENNVAASSFLRLDCILSAAKAIDILKEKYYEDEKRAGDKELIVKTLSEFLGYSGNVFHASCGFLNGRKFVTSFSKRWNSSQDELVNFKGKGKEQIDTARGFFKSYHSTIQCFSAREITFYARGNKEEIERLLQYIKFIGKKSSQGFGKIKYWKVTTIENDRSLIYKNKAMRFLPCSEFETMLDVHEHSKEIVALIPPASRKDCKEICFVPCK